MSQSATQLIKVPAAKNSWIPFMILLSALSALGSISVARLYKYPDIAVPGCCLSGIILSILTIQQNEKNRLNEILINVAQESNEKVLARLISSQELAQTQQIQLELNDDLSNLRQTEIPTKKRDLQTHLDLLELAEYEASVIERVKELEEQE